MKLQYTRIAKQAATVALLSSLLSGTAWTAGPVARASAANWEIYDQGQHLLLPEGPIDENGVLMVPLRPIAERFGYTIAKSTASEVVLKGGVIGQVSLKPGSTKAVLNGTVARTIQPAPRTINGTLFIPLSFAGELTDIGYTVVPGTNLIQLRPAEVQASGSTESVLDAQYWHAFNTSDGVVYVDNQGKERLRKPGLSGMGFGYEDVAPVKGPYGGYGLIDRSGKTVMKVNAKYYRVDGFNEGLATFTTLTKDYIVKMGALNRQGREVLPAVYDRLYAFSEGLAKVVKDDKTYYIDHTGRTVIPPIAGSLHTGSFSEGLAPVSKWVKVGGKSVERTGYIDRTGKFAIAPQFETATAFSEGLAIAVQNGKTGYIDRQGKWVIKPTYAPGWTGDFHEGYARVMVQENGGYRSFLIDKTGKAVSLGAVRDIGDVGDGLVSFYAGELVGFKNLKGETVIAPQFTSAWTFAQGVANFSNWKGGNDYVYGLVDRAGKVLWSSDKATER
ncbi:WG repeat-containing protein [Cohnella sp. GCM10020058]|uniref:WG repeat-containing protein n=1 Tax=Cohnella sp. GCM10020058 TaxID=3317330 RepID=UPI0036412B33